MHISRDGRTRVLAIIPALACVALAACGRGASTGGGRPPYRDAALPIDGRVEDLLARMTPEEKFRQLFMVSGDVAGAESDYAGGIFGLQFRAAGAREQAEK